MGRGRHRRSPPRLRPSETDQVAAGLGDSAGPAGLPESVEDPILGGLRDGEATAGDVFENAQGVLASESIGVRPGIGLRWSRHEPYRKRNHHPDCSRQRGAHRPRFGESPYWARVGASSHRTCVGASPHRTCVGAGPHRTPVGAGSHELRLGRRIGARAASARRLGAGCHPCCRPTVADGTLVVPKPLNDQPIREPLAELSSDLCTHAVADLSVRRTLDPRGGGPGASPCRDRVSSGPPR